MGVSFAQGPIKDIFNSISGFLRAVVGQKIDNQLDQSPSIN